MGNRVVSALLAEDLGDCPFFSSRILLCKTVCGLSRPRLGTRCEPLSWIYYVKNKNKNLVGAIAGPETDVEFGQGGVEHCRLHQVFFARRLFGLDSPR